MHPPLQNSAQDTARVGTPRGVRAHEPQAPRVPPGSEDPPVRDPEPPAPPAPRKDPPGGEPERKEPPGSREPPVQEPETPVPVEPPPPKQQR